MYYEEEAIKTGLQPPTLYFEYCLIKHILYSIDYK